MFKNIISFSILAISLSMLITACGPNDSSKNPDKEENIGLIVSAAASLTDAAEELKRAFSEENPSVDLTYNFGGSGNLSQQIKQGAPADVFLSASERDMDRLSESDLILEDTRFNFAYNELVIVTEQTNKISLPKIEEIVNLEIRNIVMGDSEAVPAGRYGKESFESIGAWEKIETKMVYVSDVRQVLAQVETGNAELGIVYSTDVAQADDVKVVTKIDSSLHAPIVYPAAVINGSKNHEAARAYLDFLKSEKGKGILKSYGFITD